MEPDRHDPLQSLRSAWQQVEAPEATRDFEQEDERTRAVVSWMQTAWEQVEPPAARPELAYRHLAARPRRLVSWGRLAAAAAVLAGLGLALSSLEGPEELWRAGEPQVRQNRAASSETGISDESASEQEASPSASSTTANDAAPDADLLVQAHEDRLEMRSGNVRLILLNPIE